MKISKLLSAGLLSALVFTSCVNNEDNSEWNDGKQGIRFTSTINGLTTRATNANWTAGDEVGIFMKAADGDIASAISANKKFTTDAQGNLSAATAADALYFPDNGSAVDFIAYYPYTTSLSGQTYKVNVSDQANQAAIDLLYSNNARALSSGTPALNFNHKLAKVLMNIEVTDGSIPSINGLTVSIQGLNTTADFALADGTLSNAAAPGAINLKVDEAAKTAEAIVIPGALSGVKATFTLNGIALDANITTPQFEAGSKYIYTVKLSHSGQKPSIQFGQASITDWTDVPSGDIDIDFGGGSEVPTGIVITEDKPYIGLVESQGDFTIKDVTLPEGGSYVWKWDTFNESSYMKASAYVGGPKVSESWLISPAINLSQVTEATLTFDHTHKFAGTPENELTLWIAEAETENWTQLTITPYASNNDYTFVTPSIDLTAYIGKTVKIAFKYISTTTAAGTWEVKNVKVAVPGEKPVEPDPVDGIIFKEQIGSSKGEASKTAIGAFTNWDCPWLTFSDSYGTADIRAIAHKTPDNRTETVKVNNVWLPSGKDSELVISGFDAAGYKTLTLTYEAAANVFNNGASIDLNAIEVYFNDEKVTVPSQVVSKDNEDANVFYNMTVTLDAAKGTDNSKLQFKALGATNTMGFRLYNIQLKGEK